MEGCSTLRQTSSASGRGTHLNVVILFITRSRNAVKLRGTELQQAILQTGLDALGRYGMVYQSDALHSGWNGEIIGPSVPNIVR